MAKIKLFSVNTPTLVAIELLTNGEYFRLNQAGKQGKKTYTADGYCRENKKYTGTDCDDFCAQTFKKKGTLVWIGFDY